MTMNNVIVIYMLTSILSMKGIDFEYCTNADDVIYVEKLEERM